MRYNPHVAQPATPNTQSPSGRSIQSPTGGVAVTGFQGWPPDFCPEGFFMSGLTADLARELFSYEPDTGIMRWRKPGGSKRKSLVAGTRTHGYLSVRVSGRQYQVHRVAWLYVKGAWPNNQIDHINGIRDDNRIINLRDVPIRVNNENLRRARADNGCGVFGATWLERLQSYAVMIQVHGKKHHVGLFKDAESARQAYISAKRKLHTGCTL